MKRAAILAACLFLMAVVATPAHATFPGDNGKLAVPYFSGTSSVATASPDGTGLTRLTEEPAFGPAWSPDGRQIAFVRHVAGGRSHISVMDADGGNPRLVYDTDDLVLGLTWAPDGGHITFSSQPDIPFPNISQDISTLDLDTGTAQKFVDAPANERAAEPDWSPDGRQLAFAQYRHELVCDEDHECSLIEIGQVHTVNSDGSGLRRLTTTGGENPSWSPDGRRIAYSVSGGAVLVMNADGTGHRILNSGLAPVWSPDATKIASHLQGDVFVMNADGSNRVRILDGGLQPGSVTYQAPDWQAIPNAPPDCSSVRPAPGVLWPPNKKLRTVMLFGATAADGDEVSLEVTGVTQDEPAGARPDFQLGGGTVRLRAERDPKGDGRAYTAAFQVTDEHGASCTGTVTVSVPRHKR